MDIHAGDYVTLKSVEEVKSIYKFWKTTDGGSVDTDTNHFAESMLDAMGTSNMYQVVGVTPDDVWVDIAGTFWEFEKKCIKDIYRPTKVN